MAQLLGIFDPTLWTVPFVIPAIVYIIAKDRGWRQGWRERAGREAHTARTAHNISTH